MHFAPGQLPPVNAFWSLTMYQLPASLLYANALNRYLINSPMLQNLKRDADGGLTLYVQHDSPGARVAGGHHRTAKRASIARRGHFALGASTGELLACEAGDPPIWLPPGLAAIEFRCRGTSRDGQSPPTDRESGECRSNFVCAGA